MALDDMDIRHGFSGCNGVFDSPHFSSYLSRYKATFGVGFNFVIVMGYRLSQIRNEITIYGDKLKPGCHQGCHVMRINSVL